MSTETGANGGRVVGSPEYNLHFKDFPTFPIMNCEYFSVIRIVKLLSLLDPPWYIGSTSWLL